MRSVDVAETVKVEQEGTLVPLSRLVETRKRQIGKIDPEVITLSALRVLVIAAIFGRTGIAQSSETVHREDLPDGVAAEQIEREGVKIVSELLTDLFPVLWPRGRRSPPRPSSRAWASSRTRSPPGVPGT
ncbi:hypothetical protein E1281_38525 [Actinomadura sp. KC345]|uniref:hypothetical protein n=1 Tax=Actinomadura sp. KC345 TaxID=2530371 RepID=UPI001052F64D|nr:hypothetical protein [Actinomadura sp. KC345]TDC39847.1 hypothetical protein E1281_38525 [Actinomadura sp. KC345]